MSKNRRKVTVEGDKSSDDEGGSKRSKPSVFERLGPGSAPRQSFEGEERSCRNWVKTGACPYGATCRFLHPPYKGGRSKSRKSEGAEEGGEDSKHRKHRGEKEKHRPRRSQSPSPKRGSRGHPRRDKDGKMKSAVVVNVKKRLGRAGGDSDGESDSAPWPEAEDSTFDDLDYKDELQLEQKRQELERVLQQLPSEEERENITIQKKGSSSSDSSSSSGSSSGSSSSGSSSSRSPSPVRKKKPSRQKSPSNQQQRRPSPGYRGKSPTTASHQLRSPPVAGQRRSGSPSQQFRNSPQLGSQSGSMRSPKNLQTNMEKLVPSREKPDKQRERDRSPRSPKPAPNREFSPPPAREHVQRREITPVPLDRSQESTPSRLSSPAQSSSAYSPEKTAHGIRGGKASGKKKKAEKQKEKVKGKGPRTPSPSDWDPREAPGKTRTKDHKRQADVEKEKPTHKEKHKKRNRSPVLEDKKHKGHNLPPRSKSKGERSVSPDFERKRSDVGDRHDTDSDPASPQRKSRKSVSPSKEKSKRSKKRGRTLSVSPLRTKKLSPAPSKSKEVFKDSKEAKQKAKLRDAFPDMPGQSEERSPEPEPEPEVKVKSRGRSPGQAPVREKHKKKKDLSAEKKKRKHESPEKISPTKHSRKRKESPETPVKSSKRGSVEKAGQVSPTKRSSRSKSGKRKEGRKGHKGEWEPEQQETEDKGRGRNESDRDRERFRDSSRLRADRPPSPDQPPPRSGRDSRRSPPPEVFDQRGPSRGGDGRRPATPPRHPDSPGDGFRQRGSPSRFPRGGREEPGFPPLGGRRRPGPDEEYGRPPASASPPGVRRGREGRFRDEYEPRDGRRDPDPDGPRSLDPRYMDPRERDRSGRFPEIRPLFDDRPGSRAEQERLLELERFEREADRLRGREGFGRDRYGRERFPGRGDRFDDGRIGGLGGRDPRPLGVGGPPWERDFPREGGRGMPGDRFPPGRVFDDPVPERLSRRGDWESRRMEFRDEWNPRGARGDDRRDMRRRGEFLDSRDDRRFEEPGMFRRMEHDDMMRMRMEGEFRDRRDPSGRRDSSDPRDPGFPELRRGDRRDDRPEEGLDRARRDDRRDDRRREDREGDRKTDRREDSRKRPHEGEDDRGRSPPIKRLRELSPSAASMRSHESNLEQTERDGEKWERDRRRDRSQDVPGRDRDRDGRGSADRRSREQDLSREGNSDPSKDEAKSQSMRSANDSEGSRLPADSDRKRESLMDRDRSSSKPKSLTHEADDKEADKESVKSAVLRSLKDRESHKDRLKESTQGSPDRLSDRAIRRENDRDRDSVVDRDREATSEKGSRRERDLDSVSDRGSRQDRHRDDPRERDRDTASVRSSNRDRDVQSDRSRNRDRSSNRDREGRSGRDSRERSGEPGLVRDRERIPQGDSVSESGRRRRNQSRERDRPPSEVSDRPSDRHQDDSIDKKSIPVKTDKIKDETDRESLKDQPTVSQECTEANSKGDGDLQPSEQEGEAKKKPEIKSEMYDPFDVESNDDVKEENDALETATAKSTGDKPAGETKSSEVGGQKRRLSTGSLGDIAMGQQKKQRMIELTDGKLSETLHPDSRHQGNVESHSNAGSERKSQVPFSGGTPDRDDGRSHGDVYSDWSSADDADDILAQPEAVPFSGQPTLQENGDGPIRDGADVRRRSQSRSRRSRSRSSHGSRRDWRGDDRGREQSLDDRRPASRHSSYDPNREDRRRLESPARSRHDDWDRFDNKPDQSDARRAGPTEATVGGEEDEKADLLETSMDYEVISDDGDIGGEDDTNTKGVMSALQIDWSSLTQDQRPKMTAGSALNRFKPAAVFGRIGIEAAYAGAGLLEEIKAACQTKLEDDGATEGGSPGKENGNGEDSDSKPDPKFTLHHSIAAFHATTVLKLKERAELFRNIGPFRRALCARKDLDVRRQLCKMDKVRYDP